MALTLHAHGGYPSYADSGEAWRQSDWDALHLVKALKGHPFKGYVTLKTVGGQWVTATATNRAPAFRIFGEWAAQTLREAGVTEGVLISVPSSSCVAPGTDAKGAAIAEAVRSRSPGLTVVDALHWRQALGKAAEGGTRDAAVLQANLIVRAVPPSRVILIDDVATSGGHLLACARALRAEGHTVEHALCLAQTVWNHPANMWAIPSRDLEENEFQNLSLDF